MRSTYSEAAVGNEIFVLQVPSKKTQKCTKEYHTQWNERWNKEKLKKTYFSALFNCNRRTFMTRRCLKTQSNHHPHASSRYGHFWLPKDGIVHNAKLEAVHKPIHHVTLDNWNCCHDCWRHNKDTTPQLAPTSFWSSEHVALSATLLAVLPLPAFG